MSKSELFEIAGRVIGPGAPPYLIAELSGNHMGELELALELLQAAKDAGADAAKIQTYTADTITIDHDGPEFRVDSGLWAGRTLHELYQEAHTPWDWHQALFAKAAEIGLPLFSSPFDSTAVELLTRLNAPAFKIASFELVDMGLIRCAAATGKPLIMSTGMANLDEIAEAVKVARAAQPASAGLALLHCTSGYPTPAGESNLQCIADLAERFGVVTGLSDHTLGIAVPVAAVALGAAIIEKHFTLTRAEGGVDAAFSLEPDEFRQMTEACRSAFDALGTPNYDLRPSEEGARKLRRSLYVVADISAGEAFTPENLRSIRPGLGLHTRYLDEILERQAAGDLQKGTPLSWDHVAPGEGE
jgi:N-acetylneuraminate synthase